MSRNEKRLKPIKAMRLQADGTLSDPNSGRTFATAKDAAAFWQTRHDILVAVDLKDFDPEPPPKKIMRGDPVKWDDGLWRAQGCGPRAFKTEEQAAAFGRWALVGGDRAAVRGKPFAANLDDLCQLVLAMDLTEQADEDRSLAISRLGRVLGPFLDSVGWINPRLDVVLAVSSEFIQATVLLGLPYLPSVRLRAFFNRGIEALSDDPEFDEGGRVSGTQDEIGVSSVLAAHVHKHATNPKAFLKWRVRPDEFKLKSSLSGIPGTVALPALCPDGVNVKKVLLGDNTVVVTNLRRTAFILATENKTSKWYWIPDAQSAKLWDAPENERVLEPVENEK